MELADGRTIHLAPAETSPEVDEADVRPSATIGRLIAAGLLTLSAPSTSTASMSSTKSTRKTASTRSQD